MAKQIVTGDTEVIVIDLEKGVTSPAMQRVPLTDGASSPQMTAVPVEKLPVEITAVDTPPSVSGAAPVDKNSK